MLSSWSVGNMPDQDDADHAEDCKCGDWEDGDIDDACHELLNVEFRPAIVRDEGAHGYSFVRWLTPEEIGQPADQVVVFDVLDVVDVLRDAVEDECEVLAERAIDPDEPDRATYSRRHAAARWLLDADKFDAMADKVAERW